MPFSSKADLKTAIAWWLARTGDSDIIGNADDFISLLEAKLNRWQPPLRTAEIEATLTGTPGSREIDLPSDFREPISLHRTTDGAYDLMRPFIAGSEELGVTNATPSAWAVSGKSGSTGPGVIILDCPEAQADTFILRYRQKFALASDGASNWLLAEHPDVYLWGSLTEARIFMQSFAKGGVYAEAFATAMEEVTTQDGRSKSLAPLTVDPILTGGGGRYNIYTGQ